MKKLINHLVVSEKFYSIQGEGRTTGFPAIFLRLAGCNLLCQSDSWVCDSIEVWKKGLKFKFEDVFDTEEVLQMEAGVHLVITGGEPMLHQKELCLFITWFIKKYGFTPYIEVETNGTIEPNNYMRQVVKQWNVSPKLRSSGETIERRFNLPALKIFNRLNTSFKFVISSVNDLDEIFLNYGELHRPKIMLMPAGSTQDELDKTRLMVIDLCKKHILKYTDRLHIVAWNQKTGV